MDPTPIKDFVRQLNAQHAVVPVEDFLAIAEEPLTVWDMWFHCRYRYEWEVLRDVKKLVQEGLAICHPPEFLDGEYARMKIKDETYEMHDWAKAELAEWHREKALEWEEKENREPPDPPPMQPVTTCLRPGCRELRRIGSDWCKDCATNALFDSSKGL